MVLSKIILISVVIILTSGTIRLRKSTILSQLIRKDCARIAVCEKCSEDTACPHGFRQKGTWCLPVTRCIQSSTVSMTARKSKAKHRTAGVKTLRATPREIKLRKSPTIKEVKAVEPVRTTTHVIAPSKDCEFGTIFTHCVCDSTCSKRKKCSVCRSGCGCLPHRVRGPTGKCIFVSQCPQKSSKFSLSKHKKNDSNFPIPPPSTSSVRAETSNAGAPSIRPRAYGAPAITPEKFFVETGHTWNGLRLLN